MDTHHLHLTWTYSQPMPWCRLTTPADRPAMRCPTEPMRPRKRAELGREKARWWRARGDLRKRLITCLNASGHQCGLEGRSPRAAWIILFYRNDLRQFFHGELRRGGRPIAVNPQKPRPSATRLQGVPIWRRQSVRGVFDEDASTYAQKGRGSGLGLAIVRETFRTHGGSCQLFENRLEDGHRDVGVTFDASLPLFAAGAPVEESDA
jgi:hypothetical protein